MTEFQRPLIQALINDGRYSRLTFWEPHREPILFDLSYIEKAKIFFILYIKEVYCYNGADMRIVASKASVLEEPPPNYTL